MHSRSARGFGGKHTTRRVLVTLLWIGAAHGAYGADIWGGSVAITTDYVVRGISRSADEPVLQLDWHYVADSGLVAGLFAANTHLYSGKPRTAELNGYLGFAWSAGSDWRGKLLAAYYAYPRTDAGAPAYDYGEFEADLYYRQWLEVAVSYRPAAPLFGPYDRIERAAAACHRRPRAGEECHGI